MLPVQTTHDALSSHCQTVLIFATCTDHTRCTLKPLLDCLDICYLHRPHTMHATALSNYCQTVLTFATCTDHTRCTLKPLLDCLDVCYLHRPHTMHSQTTARLSDVCYLHRPHTMHATALSSHCQTVLMFATCTDHTRCTLKPLLDCLDVCYLHRPHTMHATALSNHCQTV